MSATARPAAEIALKSSQFRREREATWRELEALLARADRGSLARLTPEEIAALPILYRAAVSSLSVARAISLDRNLLDYLEALVARAYVVVYANRRRPEEVLLDFVRVRFPCLVRRFAGELAVATLLLAVGVTAGFLLTRADPGRYPSFVPEERAQGRTFSSATEDLRGVLYHEPDAADALEAFASALFVNNARVALLSVGLGFVAGLPVVFLLLREGLALGAMGALYHERGLGVDFALWVAPHGITELLAIGLCAAVGLAVARALFFPGDSERLSHVASVGREAALLACGAVLMLFGAGMIEGLFRQLVTSPAVRALVALATLAGWVAYLGLAGRRGGTGALETSR
jgi:uncharacterized membrane protein SpoIIM required for sporulation